MPWSAFRKRCTDKAFQDLPRKLTTRRAWNVKYGDNSMTYSKGFAAMITGRRVTVCSAFNAGVWIGVVKVDGAVHWCSTFVASRARARELAKPIAKDVRAELLANRPITPHASPYGVSAITTVLRHERPSRRSTSPTLPSLASADANRVTSRAPRASSSSPSQRRPRPSLPRDASA